MHATMTTYSPCPVCGNWLRVPAEGNVTICPSCLTQLVVVDGALARDELREPESVKVEEQ